MGRNECVNRLIQDNDGHWYVIKRWEVASFYQWVNDMERDGISDTDFDECRVDGPHKIYFTEYIEE